ncbi:FAD/NAD(P)-binding domain-containing protein [Pseudovirgaria hyperparasitica]|uniref:FAD/NAD(P)-binding domain-containing protein n=1 Tax=Pseudovirgaria hyperparasitica TaxID=470096 RepID=A0A6A6WD88_9PEZI|nr:FAD/NAD(P)-binding domain-containing protein [Pseudovirgaria hyperparasitica]KAF2759527.1 FAD/NAD(P)-binding domain-containing protein [Pseudovirgaria hyperparasitica]
MTNTTTTAAETPTAPSTTTTTTPQTDPLTATQARYAQERNKRTTRTGFSQYIPSLHTTDPWAPSPPPTQTTTQPPPLSPKTHTPILIIGAGLAGILTAIHLLKSALPATSFLILDAAGSFGGTWYWNRYPGLRCDTEASIYLPLLEETGYVPRERYVGGEEVRGYVELLVARYGLRSRAVFGVCVRGMRWREEEGVWGVDVERVRSDGDEDEESSSAKKFSITATIALVAPGILHAPKLPLIPNLSSFTNPSFHTSRWAYDITGGSPTNPSLTSLASKRVTIIGTGATAIQCIPFLARYAAQLTVLQRTPSAIDVRDNHALSPSTFTRDVATSPGWQRARQANFAAFMNKIHPPPEVNLVNDGWTRFPSYAALLGTPSSKFDGVNMETLQAHIAEMHELDFVRSERIRARVDSVVRDPGTAEVLKAWYPGWCKRPCFHDEYLDVFNRDNVEIIDVTRTPIVRAEADGLVLAAPPSSPAEEGAQQGERSIKTDILIHSTGFNATGMGTPSTRLGAPIIGRHGISLDEAWKLAPNTLHGVVAGGFPNLFFPGPLQAAAGPNFTFVIECLVEHAVGMAVGAAKKKGKRAAGEKGEGEAEAEKGTKGPEPEPEPELEIDGLTIEPTPEATAAWADRIARDAAHFACIAGCTPGYMNSEGAFDKEMSAEERAERAKGGMWAGGLMSFVEFLEGWRAEGSLEGLEVRRAGEVVRDG